jgi:putative peptidoglycan lipid II flippase
MLRLHSWRCIRRFELPPKPIGAPAAGSLSLSTSHGAAIFLRNLRRWAIFALHRAVRHPVLRATAGFTGVTTFVKAIAFLKEAVVTAAFGVGASMDSYLMALVVIGFPSGVLLNAAQTVFVREYVRFMEPGNEAAAGRFLRSALLAALLILSVVLIAWLVLLPEILTVVGHGLRPGVRAFVSTNVHLLVPYCYLSSINLLGYGALQARKAFLRTGLIPVATPLVTIALVAAMGANLHMLIFALTLGTAAETALIFLLTNDALGLFARTSQLRQQHATRDFVRGTMFLIPGMLVFGLLPVIEQTIASGLGEGTISALGYAAKLPSTLNSLLTMAIGVTTLPYFAQRLLAGDIESSRRFFVRYAAVLAVAGAAIAAVASLGSEPFVRVAFQRGHFTTANTVLVTTLQQAYLWQLPGAMAGMAAVRYLAAQGRYRSLTTVNIVNALLTGLTQWVLAREWGGAGLALATSVGTTLSATTLVALALKSSAHPRHLGPM